MLKINAKSLSTITGENHLNPIETTESIGWNTYTWVKDENGRWLHDHARECYYFVPHEMYMEWAWHKRSIVSVLKERTDYD